MANDLPAQPVAFQYVLGERGLQTVSEPADDIDLASPMQAAAADASALLRAIGSPHRLMILCHLMEGPKTVTELCEALDLRQSLVSQHLTQLRLAALVTTDRNGHFVTYFLNNEPAREIVAVLYRHFCEPLERMK